MARVTFTNLHEEDAGTSPVLKSLFALYWVAYFDFVHPTTMAVLQYGHLDPDEGQFRPEVERPIARVDLLSASYFLFGVSFIVNTAFKLGFDKKLSAWYTGFRIIGNGLANGGDELVSVNLHDGSGA